MSKVSQKEAVYSAIMSVLANNNISISLNADINLIMNKDLRSQVNAILFQGFRNNSIDIDGTHSDSELKQYISGLQSNWLRKDKRLNGGNSFSIRNPGSRIGVSDPQIKAMRSLLSTLTSDVDKLEVQSAINSRLAELQSSKTKANINTSILPLELKSLFK